HPIGFRLGISKTWSSRWFSARGFSENLQEDIALRKYIMKRLFRASVSKVEVERRTNNEITVNIHTARPGIVIGRKGAEVDKLRDELKLLTKKDIYLNIVEVKQPELTAKLVAEGIARQLEQRVNHRRAMKKAVTSAMRLGAEGIRISCGGRLGGSEMARRERYLVGRVPLHTLRADIDYATAISYTTYGVIGVKVWLSLGEVLDTHDISK
ncbi:MAG: 30S ribosomal protein S3, partial [Candidatus Latescibacteria bacterium]|nr:30S ribosomal protein S3 [Candidatus Latescibacterota bacterium]